MRQYRCYLIGYEHEFCIAQIKASDKYSTIISFKVGYLTEVEDCRFLARKLFSSGQDVTITGRYRVEAFD